MKRQTLKCRLFLCWGVIAFLLAGCELPTADGRAATPTPVAPAATLPAESATAVASAPVRSPLPTPPPPPAPAAQATATNDASLADWTLLVYLVADNNLELSGLFDMNEMEAAGQSDSVNVLVQVDRALGETAIDGDWSDTRRYRITGDADKEIITAEPLLTLGEQNMGETAVLADFIFWGVQNYPANKYALVIWDHGAGWQGIAFDGEINEAGATDHIDLTELEAALATGLADAGIDQFDVVGFDACLMGQLDVYNTIQPFARFAVGSEELTPGLGWDYENLLRNLYANPGMSGGELASQVVNDFLNYYSSVENEDFITMAAVDLSKLPHVAYQVEQLAAALAADPEFVASAVGDARSGVEAYARIYPDDVDRFAAIDLHHFAEIVAQRTPDEQVASAAQAVMTAVEEAVLRNGAGPGLRHSRGVALYFPRHGDLYDDAYGRTTQLQNWNAFLNSYYEVGLANVPPPALTLHNVLNTVVGVQDPAFVEFQVVGRDIEGVFVEAGQILDDGRRRLVEYDRLIPEPTYLPDGRQVSEWRDGVHDDFFVWDTEVTYLYDAAGEGDFVVMWPTESGSSLFTVQGQFRRSEAETYVDANLVFDHQQDALTGVWAVQSNESDAPGEILPQPGDQFQMFNYFIDETGTLTREPGTLLAFDEASRLYFSWEPLPDGNYFLAMEAENVAGESDVDSVNLTIANSERRPGYAAYLDPYLGFQFLYPEGWFEPRYQESLLYTTNAPNDTQLLITIFPNLGDGLSAASLKEQTLQQFGDVDILYEEERLVSGLQTQQTAYGYSAASGEAHSGVFMTFIDHGRNGYVIDIDGPRENEAVIVSAMETIAETWEFADAGIGVQPGRWATVDLDTFSVAQPANFTYQPVNGWERFSAGQDTFVALRTQPTGLDTTAVVSGLVQDAGTGVDNFQIEEPIMFPLGGFLWTRVDFSYETADAGLIWGFIMGRVENDQEIVTWAEAPAVAYNELESDTFLTMIADLVLDE